MVQVKRTVVLTAVVALALLAATMAQAATAAKAERVVRAERFELVDSAGKVRAVLGPAVGGTSGLTLLDEQGKVRALIALAPGGTPVISLADDKATPVLVVYSDPDQRVRLSLVDERGRPRITLVVARDGSPGLVLTDEKGEVLFRVPSPAVAAEGAKRLDETNPQAVAKAYFAHLRDSEVEKARALAVFENDAVRQEWEKQVQDYVDRRKAGKRPWWGDPFKVQEIPGKGGRWAVMDVQWRYKTELGWHMGPHAAYMLRTVDDDTKWRVVIDQRTINMGRAFLPADETAAPAGAATPEVKNEPRAVAKAYFDHLRDSEVEKARALATFESEKVKNVWGNQVQAYVDRRKAGARMWWGDPFKVQEIPGKGGRWAVVEVQWRFKAELGWMMGTHYAYMMRTVDGKWRMVIDQRSIDMGRPFLPKDL